MFILFITVTSREKFTHIDLKQLKVVQTIDLLMTNRIFKNIIILILLKQHHFPLPYYSTDHNHKIFLLTNK